MDTILGIPIPFFWPERVGCISALITIIFGLMCYLAPRASLSILRLQTLPDVPEAVSEMRGTLAGFYIAVGVLVLLMQQPILFLVLGAGWAVTAFGRLTSMVFDSGFMRGFTTFNVVSIAIEAALAAAALWPGLAAFL